MQIELISNKLKGRRVCISVLNWGLGHASRMVPIIKEAQKKADFLVVAGNGQSFSWLKNYFSDVIFEESPPLEIIYGKNRFDTFLKLFIKALFIKRYAQKEKLFTQKIVCKHNINLIISDNNPWSFVSDIESIYITHQLNIKAPFIIGYFLNRKHRQLIRNFTSIWIPDFKEDEKSLAGALSRTIKNFITQEYIGPLSRFQGTKCKPISSVDGYNLLIASGPEPQQNIFLNEMINQLKTNNKILKIVSYKRPLVDRTENVELIINPNDGELFELICGAEQIYCRSGYSTLMDLYYLGRTAIVKATPGQWEQEYLEIYYNKKRRN